MRQIVISSLLMLAFVFAIFPLKHAGDGKVLKAHVLTVKLQKPSVLLRIAHAGPGIRKMTRPGISPCSLEMAEVGLPLPDCWNADYAIREISFRVVPLPGQMGGRAPPSISLVS